MVRDLDAALQAAADLTALPGRFLFVLDDGRGDVAGLAVDLGYRALNDDHGLLMVGSGGLGRPVNADQAVSQLIMLARAFLARRGAAWHVRDLPAPLVDGLVALPAAGTPAVPLGVVGDHACVTAPLGMISPDQVEVITRVVGDGPLVITPWRGLVLPDRAGDLRELRAVGLIADAESAWSMISACVGAPWCANSRVDTRALATAIAGWATELPRTHLSGCERRCGSPTGDHLDLVAPTLVESRAAIRSHRRV
jgi:precorrin-3B synthase